MLNDLDLSIIAQGGKVLYPNGLTQPDDMNNAERIRIAQPSKGSTYSVRVLGRQLLEAQTYSLVITGCLATPVPPSTPSPSAMPRLPPTQRPIVSGPPTISPTDSPTQSPMGIGVTEDTCEDTDNGIQVEGTSRSE